MCKDAAKRQDQGLKTEMGARPGAKGNQEFQWRQEGVRTQGNPAGSRLRG